MTRWNVLAGAILLTAGAVSGQTTFATITGIVTDPNGAVVPDVEVTATHVASNYRYSARSNEAGYYTLANLRIGEYVLRAKAAGFKEYVARDLTLAARDVRRVDLTLELGTVETTIEVSAAVSLIETETARLSDTRTHSVLISLPMNTTSGWSLFGLTPGALLSGDGNFTPRLHGSGLNQYDMTIDGVTILDGLGNVIGPVAARNETIAEFRLDMANNSAEFSGVGQITFVSKSGTNQFNGSLYHFYSSPVFRARNPFALSRSSNVSHSGGFSAGGPVLLPKLYDGRNKTFFFYSFETSRGSPVRQLLNPTVPLAAWREGDFSALAPATTVRDPFSGAPFAGNRVPASRLNPVSLRLQERFYPLPNFGDTSILQSQNYREMKVRPFDPNTYISGKIDHRFSDRFTFFVRYTWQRQHTRPYEGNLPTIGRLWRTRNTRALGSSFTQTLRSNLLNEFRAGYAFNNDPRSGAVMGKQLVQELGLVGLVDDLPDIPGILKLSFSGIGLTGLTQTDLRKPGFRNFPMQFQDHVTWFRGRHTVKFGGQLSRVTYNDLTADSALFGTVSFSNRFTGHPYADFLLGIPTSASRGPAPLKVELLRWAYDGFITDDVKVTPRLTVNLGLRYEYHEPWREMSNRLSAYDINLDRLVVPDGSMKMVNPLMPRGYLEVIEAGQTGGRYDATRLWFADGNNVAPRIGAAYRPWGNNTVFRAGFGVFYDLAPRYPAAVGVPYVIREPGYTNPLSAPPVIFPRVFPASIGGPTTTSLAAAGSPHLIQPYSMQYNFTIEHQRWNTGFRASYVGNGARKSLYTYNINQPAPDARLYIEKPRPFPKYPSFGYAANGIGHQYHSLTLEAERSFRNGLLYQASWVWSRDLNYASPENAYDMARERGVTYDIPTHRVSSHFIYQLPIGKGARWGSGLSRGLDLLVGGWQISGIFNTYSGQFLTPMWTGPDPTGTAFTSSSTPAQVTIRPDILRNPNLPSSQRSVNRWFDTAAFTRPQQGAFGTSARGVIKGPGSWILNAGVYKYINLWERVRLRCEITGTNVANHPNWANPATNISSLAQVGVISGIGAGNDIDPVGARSLRLGARLEW